MFQSGLVAIATLEVDTLVQYYQKLLSQQPTSYRTGIYAEFLLSGLEIAIFRPKEYHQTEFDHPKTTALSICFKVTDLDMVINHLITIGYPPTQDIITASHGTELHIYDPIYNRIILYQPKRMQ